MAEEINLLNPSSPLSDNVVGLEGKLRRAGSMLAGVVIVLGLLTALGYGLLTIQMQQLTAAKTQLVAAIAGQSQKEAFFVALQSRVTTVEKVLAQTSSWADAIDMALRVAGTGIITEVTVNDQSRFSLTIESGSLEDALTSVGEIRAMVGEGLLRSPILESLQFNDDGSVEMRVSFFVIFP